MKDERLKFLDLEEEIYYKMVEYTLYRHRSTKARSIWEYRETPTSKKMET